MLLDPRQGRAINRGVRAARGDIIITLDDDTQLGHPRVLENLVRASTTIRRSASPGEHHPEPRGEQLPAGCLPPGSPALLPGGGSHRRLRHGPAPVPGHAQGGLRGCRRGGRGSGAGLDPSPAQGPAGGLRWSSSRTPGSAIPSREPVEDLPHVLPQRSGERLRRRRYPERIYELTDGRPGEFPAQRPFAFRSSATRRGCWHRSSPSAGSS